MQREKLFKRQKFLKGTADCVTLWVTKKSAIGKMARVISNEKIISVKIIGIFDDFHYWGLYPETGKCAFGWRVLAEQG